MHLLSLSLSHSHSSHYLVLTCQKYWVGKPKYWGQKVVKSDKCMGVSQLLGGKCPGNPLKSTSMPRERSGILRKQIEVGLFGSSACQRRELVPEFWVSDCKGLCFRHRSPRSKGKEIMPGK